MHKVLEHVLILSYAALVALAAVYIAAILS